MHCAASSCPTVAIASVYVSPLRTVMPVGASRPPNTGVELRSSIACAGFVSSNPLFGVLFAPYMSTISAAPVSRTHAAICST
jgi:hypothetical protein